MLQLGAPMASFLIKVEKWAARLHLGPTWFAAEFYWRYSCNSRVCLSVRVWTRVNGLCITMHHLNISANLHFTGIINKNNPKGMI